MTWLETLRQALGLPVSHAGLNEGRGHIRIRCQIVADVHLPGGGTLSVRAINVNSCGITVRGAQRLKRGTRLEVDLLAARHGGAALSLPARVIWNRAQAEEFEAGLEFSDMGNEPLPNVLTFLRQELAVPVLDDQQKRRFRRVSANWPVEFAVSSMEQRQAQVKDVSPCGCLLLSRFPLLMWSDVGLSIRPDPSTPPIEAHAVVRRCTKLPNQEWWEIACPLVNISDVDQQRLVNAIEKLLVSRRSPKRS